MHVIRSGLLTVLMAIVFFGSVARAQIDPQQFRGDLAALTAAPARTIGSAGYDAAGEYLRRQIAAMPNVELRTAEFPVMVPVTESATVDLGGGRVEKIYPLWPAQA